MLKRAIYITNQVSLSEKNNQLVVLPKDSTCATIPIEDIGYVIIEHQQTMITIPAMNALSDNNVAVVTDCGMVSILMVTGKQFGNILNFYGKVEKEKPHIPQQLEFF